MPAHIHCRLLHLIVCILNRAINVFRVAYRQFEALSFLLKKILLSGYIGIKLADQIKSWG
ncbi:hypothetical protein AGR5A_Cc10010 [Agrobacterium genomosp. 5 str. CFBP 6626]|nr:hypothetical protein AGR5A_Cc10010 [Agrobacterium genomosp. 5 str. CFBP 6626]